MRNRGRVVAMFLCLTAVPARGSTTTGASAEATLEWVKKLEPAATAEAASAALASGRFAEAVAAAMGAGGPPLPAPPAASTPGLEAYPQGFRDAVGGLLAAVERARASAKGAGGAKQGALLLVRAIEAALPALRAYASTASAEGAAVDATPLREAARTIEEARRSGRPFDVHEDKLKQYEQDLKEGEISGKDLDGAFHATIDERMPHAVEHALHEVDQFLEGLRQRTDGSANAVAAPAFHLGGCVEPIMGVLRICDEDPQLLTTPVVLHIDLGGDDVYAYDVAGASGPGAVQVVIDLGGSDVYVTTSPGPGLPAVGQGAGIGGGIGILVDVLGDDTYVVDGSSPALGQGYGAGGGVGILLDVEGNDSYSLIDVHSVVLDPAPEMVSAVSPAAEVRGQGAGDAAGIGIQLDGLGADLYFAFAVSSATIPIGPLVPRPDGTVVVHTAESGAALAQVQGAASSSGPPPFAVPLAAPGIGVNVDAANPPVLAGNAYFAFSTTIAIANEWSFITFGGSRTCKAESGDALTRAQGGGSGEGLGAHASNSASSHFADAMAFTVADCFEVGFTAFNELMRSDATSGDATTEAQGTGADSGAGGMVQAGGLSTNFAFADSISVACSNCFQSDGTCTADSHTGKANVFGQGAGEGGVGALASGGFGDAQFAGAFESGSAFTIACSGGVCTPDASFSPDLPSARVQGYAGTGGIGALGDAGEEDVYSTLTLFPSGVLRIEAEFGPDGFFFGLTPGLDFDKGELDGPAGTAVFVDASLTPLGATDTYLEFGTPLSGAGDASANPPGPLVGPFVDVFTWGAGIIGVSPPAIELGIDANAP